MDTIDIAPVVRGFDTDQTRVEIFSTASEKWEPFCSQRGFFPISATICVFAQWSFISNKMRIVTMDGDVLCKNF